MNLVSTMLGNLFPFSLSLSPSRLSQHYNYVYTHLYVVLLLYRKNVIYYETLVMNINEHHHHITFKFPMSDIFL